MPMVAAINGSLDAHVQPPMAAHDLQPCVSNNATSAAGGAGAHPVAKVLASGSMLRAPVASPACTLLALNLINTSRGTCSRRHSTCDRHLVAGSTRAARAYCWRHRSAVGGKGGAADGGQLTASQRPSWPCLGALAPERSGDRHHFGSAGPQPTAMPLFPHTTDLHWSSGLLGAITKDGVPC